MHEALTPLPYPISTNPSSCTSKQKSQNASRTSTHTQSGPSPDASRDCLGTSSSLSF
ncbi:hypothetical protein GALMADRAFT_1342659 [Galerina marginata CBS 339.88]|uniref:Uncharacterized protein n=1 Tax=Galerina marginata (strain CBS 339.88) TaxID=685588 RepID=A0A067SZB0_GALM3|nr:hypothetical protein GALMADRAFT_1342659 [Galerina marginata CBS 339.88]